MRLMCMLTFTKGIRAYNFPGLLFYFFKKMQLLYKKLEYGLPFQDSRGSSSCCFISCTSSIKSEVDWAKVWCK